MTKVAISIVVVLGVAACGDDGGGASSSEELELRSAVEAYSDAFLAGDAAAAHALLSTRCRESLSEDQYATVVSTAAGAYGDATLTSFEVDEVSGDEARVTYRYDEPAIDQENEPWLREGGAWHNDDC